MALIRLSGDDWGSVCLYSDRDPEDDAALAGLCRLASVHKAAELVVDAASVEVVWKWLEFSGIALAGRIRAGGGPDGLFKDVKAVFSGGAKIAEVVFPVDFFDVDLARPPAAMVESVSAAVEAARGRPLKIALEASMLEGIAEVRAATRLLLEHGAEWVKTSSGLYSGGSTLNRLNAVLDSVAEWNSAAGKRAGVDFLFDPAGADEFVARDALRLARKSCGTEFLSRFRVSCPVRLIRSYF